nr:CheR family methyltransferase [Acuticoccus kalidii]
MARETATPEPDDRAAPASGLTAIIDLLNEETNHDFRFYKPGTIERRIERRIGLSGLKSRDLTGYRALLSENKAERDLLAADLLINVTSFFRDAKVFETIERVTIPALIGDLADDRSLRVWVAGCSTGEEAYSLAMVCCDAIAASGRKIKLQVFASDVDEAAIETARAGLYSFDIASTISSDRLDRYFAKEDGGYRITTALRGAVVFTVQDILTDPPFSRIDLVSCRNVLIYLNADAQAKVISVFDFALREGGILLIGPTETVGNTKGRFEVVAKAERLYRHVARSRVAAAPFPLSFAQTMPLLTAAQTVPSAGSRATYSEICNRAVMSSHAPAAVLINRNRQCLYSSGPTERYLRVAPGYATHDILAMATPALRTKLRLAIERVGKAEPRVDGGRSRLVHGGKAIWFRIDVQWLGAEQDLLLICFVEEAPPAGPRSSSGRTGETARIAELELELEAARAELETTIRHQEISSQEQKSINQEALSVNEEFQSTNEELLTSKEELQSLNEELTALNSQLQEALERQRLTSDDLQNVLYSTDIGTLFLDTELNIRFFTPAIKSLFSVIPGDIGRPLADLASIANDPHLIGDARRTLTGELAIEREISGRNEAWFVRRIFPYRAHDNRVEGVVITFADITERKAGAIALEAAKLDAERATRAKSRFLAAASHDLRQPLQSLMLLHGMLAQVVEGDTPQQLILRQKRALGAMSGMLNALLDINQIEAGVVIPQSKIFRISDILDRLHDEFIDVAQAQGLLLTSVPSSALVSSDPRLLEQIIRNLIGNALKYTARGKILFGCRRRGDDLRIEVWDTGIGIAAEDLGVIFDEFHQLRTSGASSPGLGLGLSIVQRIGHLLGHGIEVRSAPGKGSVFAISVRCASPVPAPVVKPVSQQRKAVARALRILIVEDDPDVLALLEQCVVQSGHSITTASDGPSALERVASDAVLPDLLLSDYSLQAGMTGVELLTALRARLDQHLPAIILTGDISSEILAIIAAEDGIRLSKPVAANELVAAITQLCGHPPRPADLVTSQPPSLSPFLVYVIDDNDDVRTAIRDVLQAAGHRVEDYATAELFLQAYRPWQECCLLVDANLPGMCGVPLIRELRARGDQTPAIVITGVGEISLAVEAMRSGAADFIEKPFGSVELLASVARALDLARDVNVTREARKLAASHVAELTPRQRDVMTRVLAGNPSKNIAADLGISQRTVENHRASIMRKMAVRSLPELARQALLAEREEP